MNKQQLATKIWESANKMRSKIEANEYKDYILGFIFYKYLSDKELKFLKDNDFAMEYCKEKLGLENPVFILNRKKIKINTLLEIDGFRANISATSGGGKQFVLESSTPLVVLPTYEKYIKKIASAIEKSLKNRTELKINEEFDKITKEQNIEL